LGIGADGIIFFSMSETHEIELKIYNSDGTLAGMCGNAARAAAHYAYKILKHPLKETLSIIVEGKKYEAFYRDGLYFLRFYSFMIIEQDKVGESILIDTGVPHLIIEKNDMKSLEVVKEGRRLRNLFNHTGGTNVDFVNFNPKKSLLRIYERGVEDETLCCGTGVMATTIFLSKKYGVKEVTYNMLGGEVFGYCDFENEDYYFGGDVELVFKGTLDG